MESYSFRPNIFVKERTYALQPDSLAWHDENGDGRVLYRDVLSVRLYGIPGGVVPGQQRCVVRPQQGRAILLSDTHYEGFGRTQNRGETYRPFVRNLLARIAAESPRTQFVVGQYWSLWVFWLLILIFGSVVLVGALVVLAAGDFPWAAVPFVGMVFVFMPTTWRMVRNGRPRRIDPQTLPFLQNDN